MTLREWFEEAEPFLSMTHYIKKRKGVRDSYPRLRINSPIHLLSQYPGVKIIPYRLRNGKLYCYGVGGLGEKNINHIREWLLKRKHQATVKPTKPTRYPSGKIYDFESYERRRKRYPRRPVDPSKPPRVSKPREPLSSENETRSEEYARTLIAQENLEGWSEPMRPSAATPFDYVTINERTGKARWYEVKIKGRDGASEQQTAFMALMRRRNDETKIVEVEL